MNKKEEAIQTAISIIFLAAELDLNRVNMYSLLIQDNLVNEISRITHDIHSASQVEKPPKEVNAMLNDIAEDDMTENLPITIWYSLFAHCYHLLEHRLNHICKFLYKHNKYKLSLDDLKGKGIFRARNYLEKVVGICLPDNSNEWEEIVIYSKIRNIIVHNDGRIDKSNPDKKVIAYINAKPNIWLDEESYQINFNVQFVEDAIKTYRNFYQTLKGILCP
jgi:hypothetical protein